MYAMETPAFGFGPLKVGDGGGGVPLVLVLVLDVVVLDVLVLDVLAMVTVMTV